jgi:hypothetical protein
LKKNHLNGGGNSAASFMRNKRTLHVAREAAFFLDNFETILLREGCPRSLVEQFAFEIFEILIERLPTGSWTNRAQFVGLDPFHAMHSQYTSTEGYVSGLYSANEYEVVLYSIAIAIPVSEPLAATSVA